MHKSTFKCNQVSSIMSPYNSNDAKKRKYEIVNYETENSGSLCTNNISHKLVNLCKENADVIKLGEYSF